MNQQPDKFFREKLEGYQRQAPLGAWDKIAAAQTQKNSRAFWWKIAASFLVVALAAYMLWPNPQQQKTELTQKDNDAVQPSPSIDTVSALPQVKKQMPDASLAEHNPIPNTRKKKSNANPVSTSVRVVVAPQHNDEPTAQQEPPTHSVSPSENNMAMNPTMEDVQALEQSQDAAPRITLTYTADDVSEYLDKKSLDEATSDDKKSSTLKKLLKKANDLKTNQDPFGELRQKKNEILALNFKSEKQRGQNK